MQFVLCAKVNYNSTICMKKKYFERKLIIIKLNKITLGKDLCFDYTILFGLNISGTLSQFVIFLKDS